ncbi:MAG: Phosphonate-transporting ATPase [Clostridia bacterium]|jgi:cobalt/nickel transport system ATP-binding protein|nr:Phosphonate-transporting ATPase [Clostridia bacterium]
MSHHYITFKDVCFSYPNSKPVLNGVNCTITHGESVALIGANGMGKSTLLSLIVGIHLNFKGSIVVGDIPVQKAALPHIREHIGYVFQDAEAQLFMPTVYEDIAFGPRNYHLPEEEVQKRVQSALDTVGISHLKDRACYTLSGGEKRAVSIATVLALSPDILLLDEPSIALDPCSRRNLIHLLKTFQHTQIIATHDLDLVMEVCRRTLIINEGTIAHDGPTKELLTNEKLLRENGLELPLCLQQPNWA